MTPTELAQYTDADEVWVRGDIVAAELARLRKRVEDADRLADEARQLHDGMFRVGYSCHNLAVAEATYRAGAK